MLACTRCFPSGARGTWIILSFFMQLRFSQSQRLPHRCVFCRCIAKLSDSLPGLIDPSESRVLCTRPSAGPCCPGDFLPALPSHIPLPHGSPGLSCSVAFSPHPVLELLNLVYPDTSCCHLSQYHGHPGLELHPAPGLTCTLGGLSWALGVGFKSRCGWSAFLQGGSGEGSASRSFRRLAVRMAEGPDPISFLCQPRLGGAFSRHKGPASLEPAAEFLTC